MSHDVYYKVIRPQASTQWRLVISKSLLLVVAVIAAMFAAQKPATILSMVAWAFSIAGSAFSRRWCSAFSGSARTGRGNRRHGGGLAGDAFTCCASSSTASTGSVCTASAWSRGWTSSPRLPASGVPVGFIVIFVISILTPPPPAATQDLIERLRYPAP